MISMRRVLAAFAVAAGFGAAVPEPASAQWERVTHQFYLPAQHNWQFRAHYPAADGLFNAFDFGHGILYERLFSEPNAPVERLEVETYNQLVHRVLPNPPRLPMPEQAFMPNYARLAPRAREMFDWAHMLHRQIYDIYADDRVTDKVAAVDEVVDYYLSRPDVAFTVQPKSMAIMDEQYYSKVFRERYPRFNGLIWAYHWLQMAVYEPLIVHDTPEQRRAGVMATVARFWDMLEDAPANLPIEMPMSPAIAPEFTARHPRAAAIFDNLHMMHDVISDILASDLVTDKRAAINDAVRQFLDPQHLAISHDEWIEMSLAHGIDNQGGPAINIIQRPEMHPVDHGAHGDHAAHAAAPPADPHAAHAQPTPAAPGAMDMAAMHRAMEFIVRLLSDPQVEARIHADPRLHEIWSDPAVQRHLEMMRRMHSGGGHDGHGGAPMQHHERDHQPGRDPGAHGHDPDHACPEKCRERCREHCPMRSGQNQHGSRGGSARGGMPGCCAR
jgi:hypothetical protein